MYLAKMLVLMLTTGCSVVFFATDDKFAYCATAAHCVQAETSQARYDDKLIGIRWTHVDRTNDIAFGKAHVEHFPELGASIAQATPGPAEVIGYPANKFEVRHADIPGQTRLIDGSEKDLISVSPPLVGGTSGGAVVQNDKLVGIVTHTTPAGGACVGGACVANKVVNAGVPIASDLFTTREGIFAAIGAALMHWWRNKKAAEEKRIHPTTAA